MPVSSTYRLQITPEFTLQDAAGVVDYLHDLGVGAIYLSPILTSTSGSQHGYDATDPTTIDSQRGGEDGWRELVAAARARGMGIVVDIVPNHLGISKPAENKAWWSVLREGRESAHAHWFDIDWSAGRINIPCLPGDGDLTALVLSEDASELRFYDHRFPVAPGTAAPGDDPRTVHDQQHYRLIPGLEGNRRLTYRRFFAVETLVGLRVEDSRVFDETHERVLRMVKEDALAGLRVDHPDGLVDPGEYFDRLRAAVGDIWIVAEKILEHGEPMPNWQVQGTTGYDAMTAVNQVFVDTKAEDFFTADYQRRTGDLRSVEDHILDGKRMVATTLFIAETNRILSLLDRGRFDEERLRSALVEVVIRLDVYRTYLPQEARALDDAAERARSAAPSLAPVIDHLVPQLRDVDREAARRFQQLSGAVMAKGVEDTAWYRANRFVALNEVGGNPASFGIPVVEFHEAMATREHLLPESMTSLSTHDTKRGEDIRARLAALAELPEEWSHFADIFAQRTTIPEPTFSHLLAQTIAAAGPIEPQRLHDYATKAMREAGLATSWTSPDAAFENAVHAAIETAYADEELSAAWHELQRLLTAPGHSNSAAQKLVQLTMPGIPDVYQGTEVWDDSLVDPDNRRPVHHDELATLLDATPVDCLDPAYKQRIVRTVLRLRRDRPELFRGYSPVMATGESADHLIGFERRGVVTVATRLPVQLAARGGWGETTIELHGTWMDQISGRSVDGTTRLAELLAQGPVALLVRS